MDEPLTLAKLREELHAGMLARNALAHMFGSLRADHYAVREVLDRLCEAVELHGHIGEGVKPSCPLCRAATDARALLAHNPLEASNDLA